MKYPNPSEVRQAQQFLDSQDQDKVELVDECRSAVNHEYGRPDRSYGDYPVGSRVSEVMRDFLDIAAEEWEELSIDEVDDLFTKIYDALEIVYADEGAAWW